MTFLLLWALFQPIPPAGYCDTQLPIGDIIEISNRTLFAQWCSKAVDNIEAFTVYLNDVAVQKLPVTQIVPADAGGWAIYQSQLQHIDPGDYKFEVTVWNTAVIPPNTTPTSNESAKTIAIQLRLRDAPTALQAAGKPRAVLQ